MRSANLIITGGIATFTTVLTVYTSPVGGRELHHWALSLGLFSSAALVSWLFFASLTIFKSNNLKGQLLILLGYGGALACSTIAGASFGVVYVVMQAENSSFQAAFHSVAIVTLGGYAIATSILIGACVYLKIAHTQRSGT